MHSHPGGRRCGVKRLTGCWCGCLDDGPCITEKPAPDRDGHCCGSYGLAELARGYGCPQHKLADDAEYVARRDAHRRDWLPTLPGFRSRPEEAAEREVEFRSWVDGDVA